MLELVDIYKSFGDVEVLKGISAKIDKGELLTFVGPSGCGKTTLLRIVGGFATATSGQVILDGEDIGKLPANMRDTRMVFQKNNILFFIFLSVRLRRINNAFLHFPRTHFSIIPVFHHSNYKRSEIRSCKKQKHPCWS